MSYVPGAKSTDPTANYAYSISASSNSNSMNMQDFLMLVVAQMQNQDLYSSSGGDNGQFMAQMAQVASMQAMQELTASFMSSMAVNFIGKYVHAEAVTTDPVTEEMARVTKEGVVERVNFNGGDVMVLVDKVWFKVKDIFVVENKAVSDVTTEETQKEETMQEETFTTSTTTNNITNNTTNNTTNNNTTTTTNTNANTTTNNTTTTNVNTENNINTNITNNNTNNTNPVTPPDEEKEKIPPSNEEDDEKTPPATNGDEDIIESQGSDGNDETPPAEDDLGYRDELEDIVPPEYEDELSGIEDYKDEFMDGNGRTDQTNPANSSGSGNRFTTNAEY